jgi:hypothetical protein
LLEQSLTGIDFVRAEQWLRRRFVALTNPFQRRFGVVHECFGVAAVCGVACEATLDRDRNRAPADSEGLAEYRVRGIVRRALAAAALGEDRHECAAAEVGKVGAATEAAFQAFGDALEDTIADVATMGVIDIAQPLDIEDDDGRPGVFFAPTAIPLY